MDLNVESSGHFHNCMGVVVRNDVTNDVTAPAAGLSRTSYIKVGEFLLECSSQVELMCRKNWTGLAC